MTDAPKRGLPQASNPGFAAQMREVALVGLGLLGNKLDTWLTMRDLQQAGIIIPHDYYLKTGSGPRIGGIGFNVAGPYEVDLTPPPTPTGLNVTAGISKIIIECDAQVYTQGHGHDRTLVYGATYSGTGPLPTFSSAVEITQFLGTIAAYATNPATEWHIWIKWKTKDGVLSVAPAGGTNGFTVTTGQDVSLLLDALTKAAEDPLAPYTKYAIRAGLFYIASDTGPTDAPFFAVVTSPITVGGVSVPTGVYMAAAFIMNGTITNAKIASLAVDDAKIANLSVSKLIAGSIAVGEYAQSTGYLAGSAGWRINGGGSAEFSDVVARGTIYASAGAIGGITIGSNYLRSTTYSLGSEGFGFNSDGTGQIGGLQIATTYIQSQNYVAGVSGFRLTYNGDLLGPGFTISGGSATFSGTLSAATGTFAGSLSAATGTFAGTLSAADGTFSGTLTAQVVDTANIVGAAVSTVYSATGSPASLSVTAPAGSSSLVILLDPGAANAGYDGASNFAPNWGIISVNGVNVAVSLGTLMYTIQNPSGTYTITGGSSGNNVASAPTSATGAATLAALLTKR